MAGQQPTVIRYPLIRFAEGNPLTAHPPIRFADGDPLTAFIR
ncbi:MAG: hypothetical protein ACE5LU_20630 [Anaerolineae bacterium]